MKLSASCNKLAKHCDLAIYSAYTGTPPSPPASPQDIDKLRDRVGPIPSEYRQFFEIHNGWPFFFQNGHRYSTDEVNRIPELDEHIKELRNEGVLPTWLEDTLWIGGNLETNDFYTLNSKGEVTWSAFGEAIENFPSLHSFLFYIAEEIEFEAENEMPETENSSKAPH